VNSTNYSKQQTVQSTANDLKKQGYVVVIEPDSSSIPFDLKQYRPDILATRGDENLIIDIKTRGSRRSIERYQEIAEIVGSHENWRFMLSTIDATASGYSSTNHPSVEALNQMLSKLDSLLSGNNYDLALPYLWSVYIAGMRIAGEHSAIPIDATSDRSVLDYMYSLGELSSDEYEFARSFLELRNKAVHSVEVNISKEAVLEIYQHTKCKLNEWELTQ